MDLGVTLALSLRVSTRLAQFVEYRTCKHRKKPPLWDKITLEVCRCTKGIDSLAICSIVALGAFYITVTRESFSRYEVILKSYHVCKDYHY